LRHPEVFEDDGRPLLASDGDKPLAHEMEPLRNPVALAPALATHEVAHGATIVGFLLRKATAAADVGRLHDANLRKGDG